MWRRLIELRAVPDTWVFSPMFNAAYCRLSYRLSQGVSGLQIGQSQDTFPIQLLNLRSTTLKQSGECDVIQLVWNPLPLPCLCLKAIPSDRRKGNKFVQVLLEVSEMPLFNPASAPQKALIETHRVELTELKTVVADAVITLSVYPAIVHNPYYAEYPVSIGFLPSEVDEGDDVAFKPAVILQAGGTYECPLGMAFGSMTARIEGFSQEASQSVYVIPVRRILDTETL